MLVALRCWGSLGGYSEACCHPPLAASVYSVSGVGGPPRPDAKLDMLLLFLRGLQHPGETAPALPHWVWSDIGWWYQVRPWCVEYVTSKHHLSNRFSSLDIHPNRSGGVRLQDYYYFCDNSNRSMHAWSGWLKYVEDSEPDQGLDVTTMPMEGSEPDQDHCAT